MRKWLLIGGVLGSIGAVVAMRRRGSSYENDEIDSAGEGEFGERDASAPAQQGAPAETRTDTTPEKLAMAARIETSFDAIRQVWPLITLDEVRQADGDLDRLAGLIAEKAEQPREQVRQRLDGIIAQETPRTSYPAH